jgi:hypothetical protein
MDMSVAERVIESSPVIVLIVMLAAVVLWRKLDVKDKMLLELQRETLGALAAVSTAVRDLRDAIERGTKK